MLEDARKDFLTGLYARDHLESFVEEAIALSEKSGKHFCVVVLDLDHFKKLNDKCGHLFGDDVLKYVASVLQMTFYNNEGFFFRYGGDEFVGVFCEGDGLTTARYMRLFLRNILRRPFLYKNKFYRILLSCGVACFPCDGKTFNDLMVRADEAMYFSKRYGHHLVTEASRMHFLKMRRILILVAVGVVIVLSLSFLGVWLFKNIIRPNMEQIKSVKIVSKPQDLDVIVLKDGAVIEGRILSENPRQVVVDLYFKKGEGKMVFQKTEIMDIKYGRHRSSKLHSKKLF